MEITEEEQWRIEHEKMHKEHAGHDVMHSEMLLIFLVALIIAQCLLMWWKTKNFKQYRLFSFVGLWIIPFGAGINKGWYRFLASWVLFTGCNLYLFNKVNQHSISGKIPRLVYKWFLSFHKVSYVLGIAGYVLIVATILGVNLIFNINSNTCLDYGIIFLCYGVYYGVLSKDLAEIASEKMACKIGYFTYEGLPKKVLEQNICAVCGDKLQLIGQPLHVQGDEDFETETEAVLALSCQHMFHEFCIRGWTIVGKMQTCPYCKEKVNISETFKNPWEKPHLLYGQMLDWVRYLVVWQPVIIIIVQGINKYLGLE
uniref:RING-type domain-containing protein n=1 Tax=Rhabditophanes sp. KR3021 TaxID=114890 RepID=A0AC35TMR1_9BILA